MTMIGASTNKKKEKKAAKKLEKQKKIQKNYHCHQKRKNQKTQLR